MHTLLVNPPWYCLMNLTGPGLPLGVAYLAGRLRGEEMPVRILDLEALLTPGLLDPDNPPPRELFHASPEYMERQDFAHPIWRQVEAAIDRMNPDVVGITAWTGALHSAWNVAKAVKASNPERVTILGGVHPTLDPTGTLNEAAVDFAFCGEGLATTPALWRALEQGGAEAARTANVPGLWFREADSVHEGGTAPLLPDLSVAPAPCYADIEPAAGSSFAGIVTSIGCPYACGFCASQPLWGRKVRERPIESCLDEIAHHVEHSGLRHFRINDDSFCLRPERVKAFCDGMRHRFGEDAPGFWVDANLASLTPTMVRQLEHAGCTHLTFGIESVVPRIQKAFIKKPIDLDAARQMIAFINTTSILSGVYLMTGFPHETEAELEETFRFVRKTRPGNPLWSIVTPYPGTQLYEYALEHKLLPEVDSAHQMHHSIATSMADIPRERHEARMREILDFCEDIRSTQRAACEERRRQQRLWRRILHPVDTARRAGRILKRALLR